MIIICETDGQRKTDTESDNYLRDRWTEKDTDREGQRGLVGNVFAVDHFRLL